MRKLKKFLALLTALSISASAFAGLATTAFAEGEDVYYTLDFEEDKTYVNNTDTAPSNSVTELWQSQYYATGLSIATDSKNSDINKYVKYLNNQGRGTRCATYFLPEQAQTLDENQRAVVEFDFQFHNGGGQGNNQIVLVGNDAMPIQNNDYEPTNKPAGTAPILKMTQPKDGKGEFFINNSGTGLADATAKSTGYKNDTWAHAKVVMNFKNKTILLTITSLDGETTYFEPAQVPMGSGQDATKLYSLHVAAARDSSYVAMDNVVVRQLRDGDLVGTYYNVTFDVDGKQTIMSGKENDTLPSLPNTAKTGYIFDGWYKNDDTENLISSETLLATPLTEDVTYTAVYHRDSEYIEPMVSLEFSDFPAGNIPTAGADENTAADNPIQVKINGEIGGNLGGDDFDERVTDLDVKWEFKGFRHIASKAAAGEAAATTDAADSNEYCDSYAEVVYDENDPTKVNFKLKSQAFNFYGEVVATVTYNGEKMTITRPMAILPTSTTDGKTLLPKQGYVTNFDWYSDDMVDYKATTSADNKAMVDVVTGGWAAAGGNSGRGLYLAKDEETGKKFMKLKSTGTNSSSFAVNKLDSAPTAQVIIEQDIKFYNNNSEILFKQENPVTWNDNATSFTVKFTGTDLNINGSKIANASAGLWYKIVASVDVTSKLCYAKLYDMEGQLLGESDIVPFTNTGSVAPTYLCYRTPDNANGELDFNNVKIYVPEIAGDLTTTISNDTLIIPTDIVLKDGINYDSMNKQVIVKKDLPDGAKATLITASYRGDKLARVSTSELTFKDGQASADAEVLGATKFMIWDSLGGMVPVCDAKTVEGTSEVANTATLTVDAKSTEGYNIISNAEWTVVDDATGEASDFVTITPDASNTHNATLTVAKGASGGTYNVTVSLGGKTKQIPVTVTGTQDSVKFTKSTSSIGIPLEEGTSQTYEYSAIVVDSENADLNKTVTLAMYDKNNVNPLANTDAISFNAETGVLTVTSAAEGTVVYIRAMSTNSENKPITRSLKVTIHGLAFDLGSGTDVAEGYTAVSPATAYNEQAGYGISSGSPTIGGEGTLDNANSDTLEGNFEFKVKVPAEKLYKVTVTYQGKMVSEKVNVDMTGVELVNTAVDEEHKNAVITSVEYTVPVIDDVLDLSFASGTFDHRYTVLEDGKNVEKTVKITAAPKVASIVIEKMTEKTARLKPHVFTVGDSTIANNGSWAYVLARDFSNYNDLSAIASFSNDGRGGKNLGSFYTGGELRDRVLNNICPGDYVMIGDMGTNGMGSKFEESFNYYIDACEALGAKIILNSYSPHGAVNGDKTWYDSATQTFNGWRQDEYDNIVRKIYEERTTEGGEKYDEKIVGFVEIGKNADASFNAYVDDFAANNHASRDDAAKAIYSCFSDHNHYSNAPLACQLMINGYGDVKGIAAQLLDIVSADLAKDSE